MNRYGIEWDRRYLELAKHISRWSKDPSRKIGAVAIGKNGQVLSQGYNGFPRGVDDSPERYELRDTKYKLVVHAEMNCIYNASYSGVSLEGSTLYVHGLPVCGECSKGVVQVGIKRVVMPKQKIPDSWKDSWNLSKMVFFESDVEWEFI